MTTENLTDLAIITQPEGRTADVWRSVVVAALEGGAEEGKPLAIRSLAVLIGGSIGDPTASVIVGVVVGLLRQLFAQSDAVAKRLKILLDEPFQSGARTLRDIASIEIRSLDELHECQRQLAHALDNFGKARSIAERDDPDRLLLISIYQSVTAALMPGGRPFAELYLASLQEQVAKWRAKAARIESAVLAIEANPSLTHSVKVLAMIQKEPAATELINQPSDNSIPRLKQSLHAKQTIKRLRDEATNIVARCQPLEKCIDIVTSILAQKATLPTGEL
jgi:hypothetical protein